MSGCVCVCVCVCVCARAGLFMCCNWISIVIVLQIHFITNKLIPNSKLVGNLKLFSGIPPISLPQGF